MKIDNPTPVFILYFPFIQSFASYNQQCLSYILSSLSLGLVTQYRLDEKERAREEWLLILYDAVHSQMAYYQSYLQQTVAQIYRDSNFEIQGVNWDEASKYLALLLTPQEIECHGLSEVIHKRKHRRGRPPGITTAEVRQKLHQPASEEDSVFTKPYRSPNKEEERK